MPPFVVVGLGNPGPAYARTRHNVGLTFVETVADRLGLKLRRHLGQIRTAETTLEGRAVVLAAPTTLMNESGRAVARLVHKTGVKPPALLVVHDELDIPLGRVRLKAGGGTAGHHGLDSVCASLRSKDFLRLRIGIGRPEVGQDGTGKVLSRFRPEEEPAIAAAIARSVEGLHVLLRDGVDAAQGFLHTDAR